MLSPSPLLLLAVFCLLLQVIAATTSHTARHVQKKTKHNDADAIAKEDDPSLPPLIPGRIKMPAHVPKFDLTMEEQAIQLNGKVPQGELSQFGLALNDNVTMPTTMQHYRKLASSLKKEDEHEKVTDQSIVALLKETASLSSSAYCRSVVPGGKWTNESALAHLKFVDIIYSGKLADVAGYVVRDDRKKEIFLVFKGTSSFGNAVADMLFVKTKYHPVDGGASVHKGFYESYKLVQQKVLSLMGQEIKKHSNYHVTVTGHSLGGAYATLAALDLYQRDKRFNKNSMSIITFGEPRVGNPEFAAYGASTGIVKKRVVFHKDIVPHVPPMMMGFLHFGTEHWIQKNKKDIYRCDSNHELKNCSNSIVPFTSLVDHTRYFEKKFDTCE